MLVQQTHHIGHEYTSETTGAEKFYPVRLQGPLGHKVKNLRVWALVHSKSASCKVNVYVKHAPSQTFREFPTHSTPIAEGAFNTTAQLLPGHTDVNTNGPLGPHLEIVVGIVGNGAVGAARLEIWVDAGPLA